MMHTNLFGTVMGDEAAPSQQQSPIVHKIAVESTVISEDGLSLEDSNLKAFAADISILLNILPHNDSSFIAHQILKSQIATLEKIQILVYLIYDKALEDPIFSAECAQLCSYLINKTGAEDYFVLNFRKCFIKYCEDKFEKHESAEVQRFRKLNEIEKEASDVKKLELRLKMEDDEWQDMRRYLMHARFIGELFKIGFLNQSIMMRCIDHLINAGGEMRLKCLSFLLLRIGRHLEMALSLRENDLDLYFTEMEDIANDEYTSSDVKTSVLDAVKLRKNNWSPGNEAEAKSMIQASRRDGNECDSDELVQKCTIGILETWKEIKDFSTKIVILLHRLSPNNCEIIAEQLLYLSIDTVDKLKRIVNYIFEKAVIEPKLSAACAGLCKHLYQPSFGKRIEGHGFAHFLRKCILKLSQSEFEKDTSTHFGIKKKLNEIVKETLEDKKNTLRLQLTESLSLLRIKSLGVSRFVGELYLVGMVHSPIIMYCIDWLLESEDEDDIECLCVLMTIVGKVLEENTAKSEKLQQEMKKYFSKMEDKLNDKKTLAENKIMLEKVIVLRKNKWISRGVESNPRKRDLEDVMESLIQAQPMPDNQSLLSSDIETKPKEDRAEVTEDIQQKVPSLTYADSNKISEEYTTSENDLLSVPVLKMDEKITPGKNFENKTSSLANYIACPNFILNNIYEEDQWSPINPQGKKKYGRDFLLKLRYCPLSLRYPDFSVDADAILPYDPNRCETEDLLVSQDGHFELAKPYVKAAKVAKVTPKRNPKLPSPEPSIDNQELEEESVDEVSIKLSETTKEILFHITPNSYDEVALKILKLQISDVSHLKAVVNPLFEKAVEAMYVSETYAGLCLYLNNANFGWQALKDEDPSDNFKKVLMECFKREFQRKNPVASKLQSAVRSLGVTRFLGELYKLGMITDSILVMSIKNLLKSGDDISFEELCTLISERKTF